ncbi:hypothetical protein KUCAC02_031451 [Chaenocephalus aceratus]|nr:hypothetical protein KUCAC02_031451 [Chaenocephalus aceratus]
MCDAKHPETLTSTQLRKRIATLIQSMNLQDHEMDQVAKFMDTTYEYIGSTTTQLKTPCTWRRGVNSVWP